LDTTNGKTAHRFAFTESEHPRAFSPDGQFVAVEKYVESSERMLDRWLRKLPSLKLTRPATNRLQLVAVETGQVTFDQGLIGSVAQVQFGSNGGMLVVEENQSHTLWYWDIPPRKSLTWLAGGAALLALPIALLASRRVRRLRAA
jgi:hypothetical protein